MAAGVHSDAALGVDDEKLRRHPGWWALAIRRFRRNRLSLVGLTLVSSFLLVGIIGPIVAPYPAWQPHFDSTWQFPSKQFLFGTDALGRDVLSRLLEGARTSLLVATLATFLNLLIGVTLGSVAGLLGGAVDIVIMRIVDIIFSMPVLLLTIVMVSALGNGLLNLIAAMCITGWVGIAYLMRAQIISLRDREYVTAARVLGANAPRILTRHLLPNALAPLIVSIAFAFPNAIWTEAGLSFLGLGLSRNIPSWGRMVSEGSANFNFYWHLALFPGLCLAAVMFGFTFLGDGLRDALDPTTI